MGNIVNSYTERVRNAHQARMRFVAVLVALALLVTSGVFWQLRYTGIAMANETYCGYEEHEHDESCYETIPACGREESVSIVGHTHDESCYSEIETLICELEEDENHTHSEECYVTETVLTCGLEEREAVDGHTHDESCYETVLVCDREEHVHTVMCMNNEEADVETAEIWEKTIPDKLSGNWAEDVVAVAESQLGYTESESNFYYDEENETQRGYTRYGAWYGNDYGDWDAMFASFCLYYAGVPEETFPESAGVSTWIANLRNFEAVDLTGETHLYAAVENETYTPKPGDLVFLDSLNIDNYFDGVADRVGIVTGIETKTDTETGNEIEMLQVVEGNYDDAVTATEYALDDVQIIGYGILPEAPAEPEIFEISYETDMPDVISVEGPETIAEGETLTFSVSVLTDCGYEIEEVDANGDELVADDISADGDVITYDYVIEDVTEDMIVTFAAQQVIDGSGELTVYDTADPYASYTLIVTDVPTNTKVTPDSPHVKLVDASGDDVYPDDTLLSQVIFYREDIENSENLTSISYLMLDDGPDEDGNYTVNAYGSDGKAFDLESGQLVITSDSIRTVTLNVYSIQEDLLCSKAQNFEDQYDEENSEYEHHNTGTYSETLYTFTFLSSTPQNHTVVGYDGDTRTLTGITGSEKFYYGSRVPVTDNTEDVEELHTDAYPCDTVEIVTIGEENLILPLNEDGKPVYAVIETEDEDGNITAIEEIDVVFDESGNASLVDPDGNTVTGVTSNVTVYMVRDTLYTFEITTQNMVNEHTEDNGDVYLWQGTEYYVDQYYNMGTTSSGYTNSLATSSACVGVFVQLGRARESVINGLLDAENLTYDAKTVFGMYANVVIDTDKTSTSNEKTSDSTATFTSDTTNELYSSTYGTDPETAVLTTLSSSTTGLSTSYNYGISGPYYATEGDTAWVPEITYVTGHLGDEFVTDDVDGWENRTIYLIDDTQDKGESYEDAEGETDYGKHRTDWIDLGAHPSDGGARAWWYWINDYYVLNNYKNQVEYLAIKEVENEDTGETEVHLLVDELGYDKDYQGEDTEDVDAEHPAVETGESVGTGKLLDLFDDEIIIATKRDSVIKADMIANPDNYKYTDDNKTTTTGIDFSDVTGKPHHIQLRLFTNVEIVEQDKHYEGNLKIIGAIDDDTTYTDSAGNTIDNAGTITKVNLSYSGGALLADGVTKDSGTSNLGVVGSQTPYYCQLPYLTYSLDPDIVTDSSGTLFDTGGERITNESYIQMENAQEAVAMNFTYNDTSAYISNSATTKAGDTAMFDPDSVTITVRLCFTGTLECQEDGDTKKYTENDPLVYETTLTGTQLAEAYDTCPNAAGYDVAIHPSDSLKVLNGYGDQITLYKIWQDNQNQYGTRDGIESVGVILERAEADSDEWTTVMYDYHANATDEDSKKGTDIFSPYAFEYNEADGVWEETQNQIIGAYTSDDDYNGAAVFYIPASDDETADTWSLLVTSNNIPMTYTETGIESFPETKYYQYRIAGEVSTASHSGIYVGARLGDDEQTRNTYVNSISTDNIVFSGQKIWLDENGDKVSGVTDPESITIGLYQDDKFYSLETVSAEDGWKFQFTAPKSDYYGTPYDYQLYELDADGNRVENGQVVLLNEKWYEVSVDIVEDEEGNTTYTVTNQYVGPAELPVMGGTGTWYPVLTGVLLMGGAGALLYRKKKGVIVRQ